MGLGGWFSPRYYGTRENDHYLYLNGLGRYKSLDKEITDCGLQYSVRILFLFASVKTTLGRIPENILDRTRLRLLSRRTYITRRLPTDSNLLKEWG